MDNEWDRVDFSKLRLKCGDGGLVCHFVLGALASKHVVEGLCGHVASEACAGGVLVPGA